MSDIEDKEGQVPVDVPPFGAYATSAHANYATADNEKSGNSLKGSKPKDFDSSRKESENFWDDFETHWKINRKNNTMKEPYSRVLMATSFMKGEKVRDWVCAQRKPLQKRVDKEHYSENSEHLWECFEYNFKKAFTDTTQKQDAYIKLKELKMEGDNLQTYAAKHEALVHRTGWDLKGEAAMETFKNGLKKQLGLAVLRNSQGEPPETLAGWQKAADFEHKKWKLVQASRFLDSKRDKMDRWKKALGKKNGPTHTKDPDAMDVDNMSLAPLTDEERTRLSKEGHCFCCRRLGHISRNCTEWKKTQTNEIKEKKETHTKTRVAKIVDDRDNLSDMGSDTTAVSARTAKVAKINASDMRPTDLVKVLERWSDKDKNELLDQILLKREDF
jgi:hypothetical protein